MMAFQRDWGNERRTHEWRALVLNELLLRFRNAGVPGAAGAPAVPAEALDAELAPLFALFEASECAADAVDADARSQAAAARTDAAEQTRALVGDAHQRSALEQATEAAARVARADATCASLRMRAAAEVARIDAVVPQRLAPLAAEVAAGILARAGTVVQP
jgi:flagellar biosynthesis/type III secretory pathway protein FliH